MYNAFKIMDGYRTEQSGLIDIHLVILNVSDFGHMWLLLTIEVKTYTGDLPISSRWLLHAGISSI